MKKIIEAISKKEEVDKKVIEEGIKEGSIVVVKNSRRDIEPLGIGSPLSIKINANIGTSEMSSNIKEEMEKVLVCEEFGADAIMDLSTGGDLKKIRKEILSITKLPLGTVPIYQIAHKLLIKKKVGIERMDIKDFLEVVEEQGEEGVDFMTIHSGLTKSCVERLKKNKRMLGVVSRGGSLLVEWMEKNNKENPLYEHFDEILKIAKKYNITISLGDGLRPGSTIDATDAPQINELIILGELVKRCREEGVPVIVEGPGHVPINQIETNIKLQKSLCHNAPFYVLGPLVTDIGAGYDHIVASIGGAWAGYFGADFLCYVTPAEHLKLPSISEVKEGVIALKIAAHAADLARGNKRAWRKEKEMAQARRELDWENQIKLTFNPEKAKKMVGEKLHKEDPCTMCGDLCAIKTSERCKI